MGELWADIWPEEPISRNTSSTPRRPGKPPVTTIRSWLECYNRMAAILTSRFPEKAAELWAYQTTIIHAAHTYEEANWVAYDRLYRREMLAAKNLNWPVPNPRLYSEAFTGRAKRHPQCPPLPVGRPLSGRLSPQPQPSNGGVVPGHSATPVRAGHVWAAGVHIADETTHPGDMQEFQQQPMPLHEVSVPTCLCRMLWPARGPLLPESTVIVGLRGASTWPRPHSAPPRPQPPLLPKG